MNAVVFLGPTLPVDDARPLLDAHFLPPVAMGDVYDVVERIRPDSIAIIDGYFDSVPAVWHREILFALSRGIRVLGASSMGALRAAELWTLGMEGVGYVFEAYRSGDLEDDDEVAVLHGDADTGYRPLSTAMINLRVGLERAYDGGLIARRARDAMIAAAKEWFYPDRSWSRLLHEAASFGISELDCERLRRFVDEEKPDAKRDDACELLRLLAVQTADATASSASMAEGREFVPTVFWDKLAQTERRVGSTSAEPVRAESFRRFTKATEFDVVQLLRTGLLLQLVDSVCQTLGIEVTQEGFDDAVRDFRVRHDLLTADAVREWIDGCELTTEEFHALMQAEARIAALANVYQSEIDGQLIHALALDGGLAEAWVRFREAERRATSIERGSGSDVQPSVAELETFYRSRVRQFRGPLHRHARSLGFSSGEELIEEIRKIFPLAGAAPGARPCG